MFDFGKSGLLCISGDVYSVYNDYKVLLYGEFVDLGLVGLGVVVIDVILEYLLIFFSMSLGIWVDYLEFLNNFRKCI